MLQIMTVTSDSILIPGDSLVHVRLAHQVAAHVGGAALFQVRNVVLIGQNQQAEDSVSRQCYLATVDVPEKITILEL